MTLSERWNPCIYHIGKDARGFVEQYFCDPSRQILILGGAGFDPRSTHVVNQLHAVAEGRLTGSFIREERPSPDTDLVGRGDATETELRTLIPKADILPIEMFSTDGAPVGGRHVVKAIDQSISIEGVTDLVLDCSALSSGAMFPLAKYCLAKAEAARHLNLHLFVLDAPTTDYAIRSVPCEQIASFHSFKGGLDLDANTSAAKLWLPQLGTQRAEVLNRIFEHIEPHAVCPIIPFPSANPRLGDSLIEEFGHLFTAGVEGVRLSWHVDARDFVYAHEQNPLDLYRAILRLDDARKRVFRDTGGSQLILSPLGSKAVSLGILMAAIERDFPVVSIETIEYTVDKKFSKLDPYSSAQLVHVWLYGDAYNNKSDG